jgi:ATP-binding cassette, subfamily B, bacterial
MAPNPKNTLAAKRFFAYLSPYRWHLRWAVSSSVLNKIFDLMPPLLVGWVIDTLRGAPPSWIQIFTNRQDAFYLAALLSGVAVLIFFFESLFQWAYQHGFMTLAQRVQHDLRMDTYHHLQHREMAYFENHRLGETLSIVNDDVNQMERFLNTGLNEVVQITVLMLMSGAIMVSISWQLAIIGMLPIPLILWGSMAYQRLIAPRYKKVREAVGNLNSRLENNISGIMVIQSFGAETFEEQRVQESSNTYQQVNRLAILVSAKYVPLIRMAVVAGFAGVLLVGSYWVLQDNGILTVGELVLFAMLTERLLWPLTRLGSTLDDYERAMASCQRIFGIIDTPSAIQEVSHPVDHDPQGQISLSHVHFGYTQETSLMPVLHDISVDISPGEIIGIAGKTGCGKSTLVKLLMRFYDIQSGQITLDGHPITELNLTRLRKSIALVSQDIYLFHGSIFDNIAYSRPNASREDVLAAAQQAALHEFVLTLQNGYDTIVGERGIRLSGGQRQRLSIARAILKNAPIMIFDEATSAVDTETEKLIHDNLNSIIKGKTAILIAHRLSTIRHANRILVLDKGRIVETGTHEALREKNGIYADLWRIQVGA